MKAIQIKYCGPTETKGARWKVWAESCPVKYYPRDYSLNGDDDAAFRAKKYRDQMEWENNLIMVTLPNGDYVAVMS